MALKQKIYETDAERKKDFRLGIVLFFGLNILLALCAWGVSTVLYNVIYSPKGTNTLLVDIIPTASCILSALPLLINIGLIIYFAFTRGQIALGWVTGFGIAFLITICLGVIFTAYCFYALTSGSY